MRAGGWRGPAGLPGLELLEAKDARPNLAGPNGAKIGPRPAAGTGVDGVCLGYRNMVDQQVLPIWPRQVRAGRSRALSGPGVSASSDAT